MRNLKSVVFFLLVGALFIQSGIAIAQNDPSQFTEQIAGYRDYKDIFTYHFVVYYNPRLTSRQYAGQIARSLETAWAYCARTGYQHPAFADVSRLAVYIKQQPSATEPLDGLYDSAPPEPLNPCLVIKNGLSANRLTETCYHQFFHFIQDAYSDWEVEGLRWFWEATATWVEDEITPQSTPRSSYLRFVTDWYPLWAGGVELDHYEPDNSNYRSMPSGSSIFFKYLSEHHPSGPAIIRTLWERIQQHGYTSTYPTLRPAPLGEEGFSRYFSDFCAAVYLKTHQPWGFRKGAQITPSITPKLSFQEWILSSYDEAEGKIRPYSCSLEPLSAAYIQLESPIDLRQPDKLHIVIRREADSRVTVKIIQFSGAASGEGPKAVEDAEFENDVAEMAVENYGRGNEAINKIILVAAAPAVQTTLQIAAAVSGPPYLQELIVAEGPNTFYHAKWDEQENVRTLQILQNKLRLNEKQSEVANISVVATFSSAIEQPPQITIAGVELEQCAKATSGTGATWQGSISRLAINADLKAQGDLPIRVSAKTPERISLDANPATPASLDGATLQWRAYESSSQGEDTHQGGVDDNHRIEIISKEKEPVPASLSQPEPKLVPGSGPELLDLNGLWKMGSSTVRIAQTGSSVEAVYVEVGPDYQATYGFQSGDMAFDGTLTQNNEIYELSGTAHGRFPVEMQSQVGLRDALGALEASVSPDGNSISGRWFQYTVDEDGQVVEKGWSSWAATRIPEPKSNSAEQRNLPVKPR